MKVTLHSHHTPSLLSNEVGSTRWPDNVWDTSDQTRFCGGYYTPMTIRRMRFARWMTRATNTNSEFVILVAYRLQNWLHERAWILRYMYIAFHVCVLCGLMYFLQLMIAFCLWGVFKHNIQPFHFAPACDRYLLLVSVPVTSTFWSFIQKTFIKIEHINHGCMY